MRFQELLQIIGAGPAGTLLAILLAQRGCRVRLFEKREDPRRAAAERGRSINLALAARGIEALKAAGLMPAIEPLLIAMRGRMVHAPGGSVEFQAYGQAAHEQIYSISRHGLNLALVEAAANQPGIEMRFDQVLTTISPATNTMFLRHGVSDNHYECGLTPTIATDGAGSAARLSLEAGGWLDSREDLLGHGYLELTIPARDGQHALDPGGLHIWPREDFMLIALPNPDASFTATLFLPTKGREASFESLGTAPQAPRQFFQKEFPDALNLMPQFDAEFAAHSSGILGTVRASRWHIGGQLLLLGDAAHAIVPFHGQGMNCAFEDCLALTELTDTVNTWEALFAAFECARRPQAEAIAQMALENYAEMRNAVIDPDYLIERALARALERLFPGRVIPRYSMVMFHPEIPYATAQQRGTALRDCVRTLRRDGYQAKDDGTPLSIELTTRLKNHPAVLALLAVVPA